MRRGAWIALAAALCVVPLPADAQTPQDLKRMSLDDLVNINVTTVSRGLGPTRLVPAAIHVITQEDIRRSGARSIPEVLRLAPGMQVARISAGTYAIGIRGFADRLARSMLVLIDGRAVYSPLFAGTYWETQDVLLEDVDRIEVIRGPGGTLWGANAVNGIINIITRPASATLGTFAMGGGGSQEHGFGSVRFGAAAGDAWNYRVYGKAFDRPSQYHPDGLDYDSLRLWQGGFRADWTPSEDRSWTIHGDVYGARLGSRPTITTYTPPYGVTANRESPLSGGNIVTKWTAPLGRSRVDLQAFYARTNRDELPVAENRDTFDVDFQQTPVRWGRHQAVWGLGYRVTSGRITAVEPSSFDPQSRLDNLYSAFLQDDITLVPGRLRTTLGTKVEHNGFSGMEVQPSARLVWTPGSRHTAWGSVTRAVRTPSRVETDYTTTSLAVPSIPGFVRLVPNPDFLPEVVVATEAGYRVQPFAPVFINVAGFFNALDDVLSTDALPRYTEPAGSPARLILPVTFANGLHGNSHGVEIAADVRAAEWWRWTGSYSYVRIELTKDPGGLDVSQERRNEGLSPRHQFVVQSSTDFAHGVTLDAFVRHASALPAGGVRKYTTGDVRLGWQVTPQVEVAAVGRDLGQSHHVEWPSGAGANIGIRRSWYLSLTWRR